MKKLNFLAPLPPLRIFLQASDCASEEGHYTRALSVFEEAIKKFPQSPELLKRYSEFLVSKKFLKQGNISYACKLAQKAVALTRWEDPSSLEILARTLFLRGDLDRAAYVLQKAVELRPQDYKLKERLIEYHKVRDVSLKQRSKK